MVVSRRSSKSVDNARGDERCEGKSREHGHRGEDLDQAGASSIAWFGPTVVMIFVTV